MAADFLTPGLDGNITEANASAVNARLDSMESSEAVTAKLLTGLAAGSDAPIAASDTILQALAKLQAQIDAL